MRWLILILVLLFAFAVWAVTRGEEVGSGAYPYEIEHPETGLPPDAHEKAEFTFARLRYPSFGSGGRGRRGRFSSGYYSWGIDSPKSERQFIIGLRRLTRVNARSVEHVVNLEGNDVYDWPFLYAVEVGHWELSDEQAAKLRDYLLRGGFLLVDDFHGVVEWEIFAASMQRVFPDRPMVELDSGDQIFHVLYDLAERFQVPGRQFLYSGRIWEVPDDIQPHWRGIYDDKQRVMVAILHNQDYGDAWEWADYPRYPEKYASQAYRLGINYLMYSMTH
jgi:hypothetical protein